MPARRYRSREPVSAADTLNLRCNSATTGRITDRFCLSDRTSPSNTSNSSQSIHIARVTEEAAPGPKARSEPEPGSAPVPVPLAGCSDRASCPAPAAFVRFASTAASPPERG
jgi:hypothetical protein